MESSLVSRLWLVSLRAGLSHSPGHSAWHILDVQEIAAELMEMTDTERGKNLLSGT